jgi:hypothetical protein
VCKTSIAAVLLALGIVSLVQEGTNAMVALPAGLRPALTMPAVETVALRKSVTSKACCACSNASSACSIAARVLITRSCWR